MFAGKAGAYFRVEHLKKALHLGKIRPYLQTLDYAGNACQGKHSSLLQKLVIYGKISLGGWTVNLLKGAVFIP